MTQKRYSAKMDENRRFRVWDHEEREFVSKAYIARSNAQDKADEYNNRLYRGWIYAGRVVVVLIALVGGFYLFG